MAQICKKCGTSFWDGARFCPSCGAALVTTNLPNGTKPVQRPAQQPRQQPVQRPVQQPRQQPVQKPAQQPRQQPVQKPVQQPRQQPVQRPVQQPRQQAVRQPVQRPVQQPKQQKAASQPKRAKNTASGKAKKFPLIPVIIIAASVVLIAGFLITAFWAPGFLINRSANDKTTDFSSKNAVAMLEYARQLEADGNSDAAAQIYSMLPDSVVKAAEEEAKKAVDKSPEKKVMDGVDDARDILNNVDGLMGD